MFAVLGEIVFQLVSSPTSAAFVSRWNYAEQPVIEDRPRLQWTGDGLQTISLELQFHRSFTNPALQLAALTAAASDHQARALILGNGDHRGYFVIVSLETTAKQMSGSGDMIAATARAQLKEWALGIELDPNAPPSPTFAPIGLVAAPAGAATGFVTYSPPGGVTSTAAASLVSFVPPSLAAPGVSPVLSNPSLSGTEVRGLLPGDVPVGNIVRATV